MKTENKTIREWFETIKNKDVRQRAFANTNEDRLEHSASKFSYALSFAFTWASTKEGHKYWESVAYKGRRPIKHRIRKAILKIVKPHILWEWTDFGFVLRIYQMEVSQYHFAIDIQVGWLNLWIQCWRKT